MIANQKSGNLSIKKIDNKKQYEGSEKNGTDHIIDLQQKLPTQLYSRQISFTDEEKVVLTSLLVDENDLSTPATVSENDINLCTSSSSFTDEMLFCRPILAQEERRDDVEHSASIPWIHRKKFDSTCWTHQNQTDESDDDFDEIPFKNNDEKTPLIPLPLFRRPKSIRRRRIKTTSDTTTQASVALSHTEEFSLSIPRPNGLVHLLKNKSTGSSFHNCTRTSLIKPNEPNSDHHTALWLAHDQGLKKRKNTKKNLARQENEINDMIVRIKNNMKGLEELPKKIEEDSEEKSIKDSVDIISTTHSCDDDDDDDDDECSNVTTGGLSKGSDSTTSSVDEIKVHYDCWQILNDEYAQDFGFAAQNAESTTATVTSPTTVDHPDLENSDCVDDDVNLHQFKILGTGPDDLSAQPHVLSPPLMDSLLNFIPNPLRYENWWLKYSLIRDGSCIDTFRQYTRASPNTILAIQTTEGDVFGSFTTSPWENHSSGGFGNGESFVWRMRLNRRTHCTSLYDQAHLESEIDVYPYSGFNSCVQICTASMIGLGGTEIEKSSSLGFSYEDYQQCARIYSSDKFKRNHDGFAITLHDDLSHGTTSSCPTFCSPSLLSNGNTSEFFEVLNVEVWTFTPVDSVNEAQKLEMRKHFVAKHSSNTSISKSRSASDFSSKDLIQEAFYRRLGS